MPIIEVVPTCYRWISTTRPAANTPDEKKMTMSFLVPASLLPMPFQIEDGDIKMEAQKQLQNREHERFATSIGCTAIRK